MASQLRRNHCAVFTKRGDVVFPPTQLIAHKRACIMREKNRTDSAQIPSAHLRRFIASLEATGQETHYSRPPGKKPNMLLRQILN